MVGECPIKKLDFCMRSISVLGMWNDALVWWKQLVELMLANTLSAQLIQYLGISAGF